MDGWFDSRMELLSALQFMWTCNKKLNVNCVTNCRLSWRVCFQDECIQRFKYLAEIVRKKQQEKTVAQQLQNPPSSANDNSAS